MLLGVFLGGVKGGGVKRGRAAKVPVNTLACCTEPPRSATEYNARGNLVEFEY